MTCPQCGTGIPNEEWNCPSCRMNVYWAQRHFEDLAARRRREGSAPSTNTPAFLVSCSKRAFEERAERLVHADGKMREIARRAMREDERR